MDVWSIGQIAAELVYREPLLEKKFNSLYANNDDTKFLKWLGNIREPVEIAKVEEFDLDLYDLLSKHVLVKEVKKRSTLPDILQHRLFSRSPIVKKTWDMKGSLTAKPNMPGRNVRLLPIDLKGIRVDPTARLESDESAAFMHEGSTEEHGDEDEEYHNNDSIPEISPRQPRRMRFWFKAVVCRC
jgi:hypothetical protein